MTDPRWTELFRRLKRQNPAPVTELHGTTPFELLIAVMLSAQATDVSVNQATERLYPIANTPEAILALGEEGLKPYIRNIGLFHTKAKHIIRTCALLRTRHASRVPADRAALEALPGVGRKTANVVLNVAFGEPTVAVDTHVFRVANRIGIAPGKTPLEVERGLLREIPKRFLKQAHHWLILHGRYVCVARKPHCTDCVVVDLCDWASQHAG